MLFQNKKFLSLEEENKQLQKCLELLQKDYNLLKKDNVESKELKFEEVIDELNQVILELKTEKDTYNKINREMAILKNNFQRDLNTLKNDEKED